MTLVLRPEIERKFQSYAQTRGLKPEEALEVLLEQEAEDDFGDVVPDSHVVHIMRGIASIQNGEEGIELNDYIALRQREKESKATA
jgi:hypothetical protein